MVSSWSVLMWQNSSPKPQDRFLINYQDHCIRHEAGGKTYECVTVASIPLLGLWCSQEWNCNGLCFSQEKHCFPSKLHLVYCCPMHSHSCTTCAVLELGVYTLEAAVWALLKTFVNEARFSTCFLLGEKKRRLRGLKPAGGRCAIAPLRCVSMVRELLQGSRQAALGEKFSFCSCY